ncbi:serine/threonine-protein kinase [Streptomyces sp. NPDC093589]|uniref:serine/threonine-protein kinase n=1 Tax=Streptomyces sp. NPDC093589 TaxID=3366043 RepID=UPI003812E898
MGIFGGEGRLIGGRYRLDLRLGRGGMGTVWRATDDLLDRQVAVKELHLDEEASGPETRVQRERAMREARTVAQIKHPNVIVVHDVVEQDGRPWIVMELVEGPSLADRLFTGGPVAPREAARIGIALLGALRAAHARGVLHRDIKPANVLMETGTNRVVLTDFGIAQVPGVTTLTEAGGFVGSPEYTAPERMAGRGTGPEADLWSLGVLLCAALSGASPFSRDSLGGVLHAVIHDEIELPEAARPLVAVVGGLLERDPLRRLDVTETERLLRGYLHSGRAPERPAGDAATHHPAEAHPPAAAPDPDPTSAEARTPLGAPAAAGHGVGRPAGRTGPRAHGVPIPHAFDDRALAAAARPHTGRTRIALLVALAVVVLGGAGAGVTALVMNQGGEDGARDATGRSQHKQKPGTQVTPSPSAGSPRPGVTIASPPERGGTATAPAGYGIVRDPLGFALATPDGFTRSYEKPRVYYYSEGKRFRLGIQLQKQVPAGPLGTMRTAHAEGPAHYPGYRRGRVVETTHNGLRAALWEFVWDGSAQDGGPRYTYDLSWNEGGKMMDVWMSAPLGSRAEAKRHFDTAADTFRLTPGS